MRIIAALLSGVLMSASLLAEEIATFGGGCFWCIEAAYDEKPGVISAISGYMGGDVKNPTYEQIGTGKTGHREVVQVTFDPNKTTYEKLLNIYWENIDPTQPDGQFADRGPQYKTAIFYHTESQKDAALKSKKDLEDSKKFDKPILVEILPAKEFYIAEKYHQNYHKENKAHYEMYKIGSGRADFIKKNWSK